MSRIEDFVKNNKIFITENALKLLKNLNDSKILEEILHEIKSRDELITENTIETLIKKYSKTPSLKDTDIESPRREVKEVTDPTMGYRLFLEDRFNKLKRIIEKITGKRSGLNSANLDKLMDKSPLTIAG